MSDFHLTVLQPFGNYNRGDHIEDDAEVTRILGGELAHHVVKVAADPKPVVVDTAGPAAAAPAPRSAPKGDASAI